MRLRNFGTISLLDLMCVAEVALDDRVLEGGETKENGAATQEPSVRADELVQPVSKWGGIVELLDVLFSVTNEFYNATTVGEAMKLDLLRLASTIGIGEDLDRFEIKDLVSSSRITDTVVNRLTALQMSMELREQTIVEQRLSAATPKKLEELGQLVGVSRERVRQIESRLLKEIQERVGKEIAIIAAVLGEKLPPVVDIEELDRSIEELFAGSEEKASVMLAVQMVKTRLNYSCADGICMDESALDVVGKLEEVAEQIWDDVGLIDGKVLRGFLPGEEWGDYFPQIVKRCGFHFIGGQLAKRNTVRARAKAALIDIGRVATTEEIVEKSRIKVFQVAKQFGEIRTVVRAGKNRWGLTEWIDDVYEGVTEEIIQRINEDGGATTLERLVKELPSRFGVSESTVHIIVGTPQFVLNDGDVSIADESSIILRDLHDVIKGKTDSGDPYWTFDVEDRYLKGHSLQRFPPELARELGCMPNNNKMVDVGHPNGCGQLSINWRLSSPTGATLGYLTESLKTLGVKRGDCVRVVIKGRGTVELYRDREEKSLLEDSETQADKWIDQMKRRREV